MPAGLDDARRRVALALGRTGLDAHAQRRQVGDLVVFEARRAPAPLAAMSGLGSSSDPMRTEGPWPSVPHDLGAVEDGPEYTSARNAPGSAPCFTLMTQL
jgi:hypothetical protein